jgi:hypothetical protein
MTGAELTLKIFRRTLRSTTNPKLRKMLLREIRELEQLC